MWMCVLSSPGQVPRKRAAGSPGSSQLHFQRNHQRYHGILTIKKLSKMSNIQRLPLNIILRNTAAAEATGVGLQVWGQRSSAVEAGLLQS